MNILVRKEAVVGFSVHFWPINWSNRTDQQLMIHCAKTLSAMDLGWHRHITKINYAEPLTDSISSSLNPYNRYTIWSISV